MKAVMMLTVMSAVAMMVWMPDQAHTANRGIEGLGDVVAELMREMTSVKNRLQAAETDFKTTKAKQASTITDLATRVTAVNGSRALNQGSSFVRWGRKTCPSSSTLVYSGTMGGKHYSYKGDGTNVLCLTRTPKYDNKSGSGSYSYLYGAEYHGVPGHYNHDAVCSVCLAPQSTTIMVPGTYLCPAGWTRQYTGHLVAAYYGHYATEYVCLDGSPEDDVGGSARRSGHQIYYVTTQCGSLPCPPYVTSKVATCAVCSK